MLEFTPIQPKTIVLFGTFKCNAECANCCNGCNPRQGRTMTFNEMKGYVDTCLAAYPDSIKRFEVTGGECMLNRDDLMCIIEYAYSRNLECGIVSNCFWATSYGTAFSVLASMYEKGLRRCMFSTGADHDKWVPWKRVRHAAIAAARLGIEVKISVESQPLVKNVWAEMQRDTTLMRLINDKRIEISLQSWMDFANGRKGHRTYHYKINKISDYVKKERCPWVFQDISIDPYGEVHFCCGIGLSRIPYFRLGNVHKEPVNIVYERAFKDVLKVWLFVEGPEKILEYVLTKNPEWKINSFGTHRCDACRVIFSDKRIIPFLRNNYDDYIDHVEMYYQIYRPVK